MGVRQYWSFGYMAWLVPEKAPLPLTHRWTGANADGWVQACFSFMTSLPTPSPQTRQLALAIFTDAFDESDPKEIREICYQLFMLGSSLACRLAKFCQVCHQQARR
jgi:hypothetical protein